MTGCPTGGHFPIIICQSGSYRLSGNVTIPDANTDAIHITASDVAIDLNGFSINGGTGIEAAGNSLVSECISRGNGGRGLAVAGVVMNNIVQGNSSDGIDRFGVITGNVVQFNKNNGIFNLLVEDALISGNVVSSNNGVGILANCPVTSSGTSPRATTRTAASLFCPERACSSITSRSELVGQDQW